LLHWNAKKVKPGVAKNGYFELKANSSELRKQTFVTKGAYSLLMKTKNTGEDD
jgi:cobalt-zinc-cadmium efflux system membrane fusion protein